jgi:hypothetical protein
VVGLTEVAGLVDDQFNAIQSTSVLIGVIPCGGKVVRTFLRLEQRDDFANGIPQRTDSAFSPCPQMGLELGESVFD